MRIAVGGIHTECSTYSPVLMAVQDFRILRGEALLAHEYFGFLRHIGADFAPLLHARAIPGGPVAQSAYEVLKAEFLQRLAEAMPVDGVYLAMHGAMKVECLWDAEGDWIAAVRRMVGPQVPIAVSYDLHGNVSQRVIDTIDIFAAYRTAPHIDVAPTMEAALSMLTRTLRTGHRPGVVRVPVPLLLPGEKSSTEDEPARGLYTALPRHEGPGVWRSDLMIGYVWADEPRATAAAIVTGTDRAACATSAERIAADFWAARHDFGFGPTTGPLDQMLELAQSATTRPVILADSGDNPTGGGVGDRADVLAALILRDWPDAVIAGITDAPAVTACFDVGEGGDLTLSIGGSLDPSSAPVRTQARVLRLDPGDSSAERQAVVRIGGITLVLAARRRPYHNLADFARLGLDPARAGLVVVKSGYLSPDLAPLANPNLMALTDGVVNQDIPRLENLHRPRGTLPFDARDDFTPKAQPSARFPV